MKIAVALLATAVPAVLGAQTLALKRTPPAPAQATFTSPEQSKQFGPVPPQQYGFPT